MFALMALDRTHATNATCTENRIWWKKSARPGQIGENAIPAFDGSRCVSDAVSDPSADSLRDQFRAEKSTSNRAAETQQLGMRPNAASGPLAPAAWRAAPGKRVNAYPPSQATDHRAVDAAAGYQQATEHLH
jgi:hypothetical protein